MLHVHVIRNTNKKHAQTFFANVDVLDYLLKVLEN